MRLKELKYRCVNCNKVFSCREGWQEHSSVDNKCRCDVFKHDKYSYTLRPHSTAKNKRSMREGELEQLETEMRDITSRNKVALKLREEKL